MGPETEFLGVEKDAVGMGAQVRLGHHVQGGGVCQGYPWRALVLKVERNH